MDATTITTAAADYAEATRFYQQGNLHRARDMAEQVLLSLSSATNTSTATSSSGCPPNTATATGGAAPGLLSPIPSRAASGERTRHQLFGNALLLLSSVYIAVRAYAEAERLLATCEGYWREHLLNANTTATAAALEQQTMRLRTKQDDAARVLACRDRDEGLAGVAYNWAVLELEKMEQLTCTSTASSRANVNTSAATDALHPAHLGANALTSSSDTQPDPSYVTSQEREEQARREREKQLQAVATEILSKYLHVARDKLSHTLGPHRCLLADVYHSCGVCHYYQMDYVRALEAWQQSMAIRVHVHRRGVSARTNEHAAADASVAHTEVSDSSVEELKIALTMEHIAHVYQHVDGKAVEALKMYDAVASTRERHLGSLHPLYARTLLAKAVLASRLGRRKLACALLDTCQRICSGENHECSLSFVKEVQRWWDFVASPK